MSAAIYFRCPACGKKLKAATQFAGRHARCTCGGTIAVPMQSFPASSQTERSVKPIPSRHPSKKTRIAPMAYAAVFSAVLVLFMPFTFPFPLFFGFLALRDIKRDPQYIGKVRAVFGIAWGALGALVSLLLTILLFQ
jgi:DNA-directed RNA polymerase subunit RPC12/RpoP